MQPELGGQDVELIARGATQIDPHGGVRGGKLFGHVIEGNSLPGERAVSIRSGKCDAHDSALLPGS
jgi:hypothetical protein